MYDAIAETLNRSPVDIGFLKFFSSGMPVEASPMISRLRTTASTVRESAQNSSKHMPLV
jgi:hypothetical protein